MLKSKFQKWIELLFIISICILHFNLRAVFFDVPLERDEGSFAYIAQQWLFHNLLPYVDILEDKPPLLYLIYMLPLKLFGPVSYVGIRVFTAIYSTITLLWLYILVRNFYGKRSALCSTIGYSIFSTGPLVQGFTSHTEVLINLPLVACFHFFLIGDNSRDKNLSLILSGIFCGLAFLIKQIAVFHLAGLSILMLWQHRYDLITFIRRIFMVYVGFFIPVILCCIYFTLNGALYELYTNTIMAIAGHMVEVYHTAFFIQKDYIQALITIFFEYIWQEEAILWILAISFTVYLCIYDLSSKNMIVIVWFLSSLVSVLFGGNFYPHHFIVLIPVLCLLSGYGLITLWLEAMPYARIFIIVSLVLIIGKMLTVEWKFYTKYSPEEISYKVYRDTRFVNAIKVAEYIKKNTTSKDYIYIWGAEPEIYFYTNLRSSSNFTNFYGMLYEAAAEQLMSRFWKRVFWRHISGCQSKEFEKIRETNPKYIIISAPLCTELLPGCTIVQDILNLLKEEYVLDVEGSKWGYKVYKLKSKCLR